MLHPLKILPLLALPLGFIGCSDVRVTDPPRTATEQFLHSVAAQLAADDVTADVLAGRRVYVDDRYLGGDLERKQRSVDRFMVGEIRGTLMEADARVVHRREDAQVIVELFSGGIGVDRYEFLLGVPLGPVFAAAGGTGEVVEEAPDVVLLKDRRQYGTAGANFVAYWADTGELIAHSGPAYGRSALQKYRFFGNLSDEGSNIPSTEEAHDEADVTQPGGG